MAQINLDDYSNIGSRAQNSDRKDKELHHEDEGLMEEAIADLLSNEDLVNVSGGENEEASDLNRQEVVYRLSEKGTNILEPGPTFPAPPPLENSL